MKELKPTALWKYFDEILEIPRPSKSEEKIIAYLEDFSKKNKLNFKRDTIGNCLISKPATQGFEDRSILVLQSHIDMVGEKLLEVDHDFYTDPIKAVIKDGWVLAEGTTLGADDGIGVAAQLAILTDDKIQHGPIECLFTVDEETGMSGAREMEPGFMEGKILLNLDSEDEGEIYIGCAGGIDTLVELDAEYESLPGDFKAVIVSVQGLRGGHSGDEIHKGFGNAIKIINRLLWNLEKEFEIKLCSFEGGKMRNAIPRETNAVIAVEADKMDSLLAYVSGFEFILRAEFGDIEPALKLNGEETEIISKCFTPKLQNAIIQSLYACPHGDMGWSKEIDGLVETSTNLAIIRMKDLDTIEIVTSQRSSSEYAKKDISDRVEAVFLLAGARVKHSDGYPGWNPDMNSEILNIAKDTYEAIFSKVPDVKAIHAGLECGLFLEKYPDLDMVSFGPTIKGAHTPEERIKIDTVEMFWDFLVKLLENAPKS